MKWIEVDQYDVAIFTLGKTKAPDPESYEYFPGDKVTWFTDGTALAYRKKDYSFGEKTKAQFYIGVPQ